ncbi:MAG: hypothetical protein R6V12_06635, partial [Candidatus Hydrogenedentota bacterium]
MRDIGVAFFLVCGVVLLAVRCDKTAQKETPLAPPDSPTAIQESGENNTSTEAPEKEPLRLAVPNRGVLTIRIPEGTVAAEIASKVPGAACLRLEGSKPDPFIITLTALGVPGMMPHFGSNAWLQEELERWKSALPDSAVAADAIPLEFQLDKVRGVYVNLQDSSAEAVAYP